MSSILKVDTIQDQSGNNIINESGNVITIGASGDTITVPAGATVSGFTSAGIDDNATSTAITIDSSERVGIGTTSMDGKLHVQSNSAGSVTANTNANLGVFEANSNSGISLLAPDNATSHIYFGSPSENRYAQIKSAYDNNSLDIGTNKSGGFLRFATDSFSERMRILSDGKMGLGTTTPAGVVGTDNVLEIAGSSNPGLVINDTGQAEKYAFHALATKLNMYYGTTAFLTYDASNSNLGIGTASPSRALTVSGSTSPFIAIVETGTSGSATLSFGDSSADNVGKIQYSNTTNSLAFVVNSSERMNIANSGRVGIGVNSPSGLLHVQSASSGASVNSSGDEIIAENSDNAGISILSGTSNVGSLFFGDSGDNNRGSLQYLHTSNDMRFMTNGNVEKLRIDSSGTLLVGKTDQTANVSGTEIEGSGTIVSTRASNTNLFLNRTGNDGQLINFRKDNSVVGSIAALNGDLALGNDDTGLRFAGGLDAIYGYNPATNSNRGSAINLGDSGVPFKDIYLSGGAFLGGTGTANKLDDYEEGTWTPTVSTATGFSTGVTSTNYATYTKIGNTVFIRSNFQLGNSSGNLTAGDVIQLTGLPFAPVAQDHVIQCGYRYNNTNNGVLSVTTAATTNRLYIICVSVTGSPARNGGGVAINFTYKV